eukprot:13579360-Heterocapsa_arctica.AAC.1
MPRSTHHRGIAPSGCALIFNGIAPSGSASYRICTNDTFFTRAQHSLSVAASAPSRALQPCCRPGAHRAAPHELALP